MKRTVLLFAMAALFWVFAYGRSTMIILGSGWDSYPYTDALWQAVIENSLDADHKIEYTHYDRDAFDPSKIVREMNVYTVKGFDRVITISLRLAEVKKNKKVSVPYIAEKGTLVAVYEFHIIALTESDGMMDNQDIEREYTVNGYSKLGTKTITAGDRLATHKKALSQLARDLAVFVK